MTSLLVAEGLHKSYQEGGRPLSVLSGADLDLAPGELTALTGPSGSGKSVLLDLLAGWSPPDAGTVRWADNPKPPGWSGLGLVPQAMGLLPDLTVWHNVVLPLRLERGATGLGAEEPFVMHLLERLGLDVLRDRSPGELSFGEQQRVSIARAVILHPPLVLADEPSSHQDARSARAVLSVLRDVCRRGGSVLLTSHDDDVLALSDRVLRITEGRVVEA